MAEASASGSVELRANIAKLLIKALVMHLFKESQCEAENLVICFDLRTNLRT